MSFTYQINGGVKFNIDPSLLQKAESFKPELICKEIKPARLVELTDEPDKLGGVGVKCSKINIENMSAVSYGRGDSLILDFGQHLVGRFSVNIDSVGSPMDAPLYLKLRFAEMPHELAYESDLYDSWLSQSWIQEEMIHIDELPTTLRLSRRYSFRYVKITVIDTSGKWKAVFANPAAVSESSANYDILPQISLQDDILQRIYDVSVRTLGECMQTVFEDGTKRDRRLWLGDLRLQALANYTTFDNTALVKRCLYLFAAMPTDDGRITANVFEKPKIAPDDTFLFDYSLFFISVLSDYLNVHSDIEMLNDLYPIAKNQMDYAVRLIDENGKLNLNCENPVFIDWSGDFDKSTCGQAVMIYALRQFIKLSEMFGNSDITRYVKTLDKMISYCKEYLLDRDKMLFKSNGEYNIASQVWAVIAEILNKDESRAVMQSTVNSLFPVRNIATPYMYHHIVEALFMTGLKDEGIALMKDYWGKMIEMGADTFWEAFMPDNTDYSPYGDPLVASYCHAWSCTPVYLIRKYLIL